MKILTEKKYKSNISFQFNDCNLKQSPRYLVTWRTLIQFFFLETAFDFTQLKQFLMVQTLNLFCENGKILSILMRQYVRKETENNFFLNLLNEIWNTGFDKKKLGKILR